jgi:hypothetical protein
MYLYYTIHDLVLCLRDSGEYMRPVIEQITCDFPKLSKPAIPFYIAATNRTPRNRSKPFAPLETDLNLSQLPKSFLRFQRFRNLSREEVPSRIGFTGPNKFL